VLFSYFLASVSIGTVAGSTNYSIFLRIGDDTKPKMKRRDFDMVTYCDLFLSFPTNFLAVYIVEKHGLRACIALGCIIMIVGSVIRGITCFQDFDIWWWYYGHMVATSASQFLKAPSTKLASSWFGDKERGFATAIGIISLP
jgi:MFS family permease